MARKNALPGSVKIRNRAEACSTICTTLITPKTDERLISGGFMGITPLYSSRTKLDLEACCWWETFSRPNRVEHDGPVHPRLRFGAISRLSGQIRNSAH